LLLLKPRKKKAATPGGLPVALREKTTKDTDGRRTRSPIIQDWGIAMKTRMMALSALTVLVAGGAIAAEPRGMQTYEFPFETDVYVPCLNEYVHDFELITVRSHEFVTQAGAYHWVSNLQSDMTLVGADTDRTWSGVAIARGPLNVKIGKGEVDQWVVRAVLKPGATGGPMLHLERHYKFTVNANGELVVDRPESPIDEWIRCVDTDH
jgi:hypothetical protein